MEVNMKNISKIPAVCAFFVFLLLATAAYVEPPSLLLEHVTGRYATWSGLELKGELQIFTGATGVVNKFTLSLAKPGMARLDTAEGSAVKNQARSNPAYEAMPEYRKAAFDLLLYSDQKVKLVDLLKGWGIDITSSHMGLLEKDPCIILGAPEAQSQTPQVWFNKDRYWPSRLILKSYAGEEKNIIDIRFIGWNLPVGADIMPAEIQIYMNGEKAETWKVKSMNRHPGLDHRFDI